MPRLETALLPWDLLCSHRTSFAPLGESHGKGTTSNGRTSQLLDQIGIEGRFGENISMNITVFWIQIGARRHQFEVFSLNAAIQFLRNAQHIKIICLQLKTIPAQIIQWKQEEYMTSYTNLKSWLHWIVWAGRVFNFFLSKVFFLFFIIKVFIY